MEEEREASRWDVKREDFEVGGWSQRKFPLISVLRSQETTFYNLLKITCIARDLQTAFALLR